MCRADHSTTSPDGRISPNRIRLVDAGAVDVTSLLLGGEECQLTTLDLAANDLRDEGALVLAEMLQANASLQSLLLSSNSINSRGLCALAHAVGGGGALQSLTLWGNRFDSAACMAWEPAIKLGAIELDFGCKQVDGTYTATKK